MGILRQVEQFCDKIVQWTGSKFRLRNVKKSLTLTVKTTPKITETPSIKFMENEDMGVLRLQQKLGHFNLHKCASEPAIVAVSLQPSIILVPPPEPEVMSNLKQQLQNTPNYDMSAKPNWMTGIFGCLRPVLSIIGKGTVGDAKGGGLTDDWEIPFEQISALQYLGCGGQGMVFSGMWNNEPVAVKKVLHIQETDIRNLRKLNHPNIVQFKGVCTQPPCFSIVMEFCPYGPLYDLLKNQKYVVTTHRVVSWTKQIASGMNYLHSQKIIHRDLKSPNVLIGEEEVIKISDFGISRTWEGVSQKMSFAGTVAWMAPEAIQESECSEKVDIWSFGVVLWELLTCEVPYDGMEQSAIMYLVGSGKLRPPIPKTCPDGFKLIMEMCWKLSPKERPSFKLILNHLQIASVEILGKFENDQFFKTQETWKEEIKSQISQLQGQLYKHRVDFQLKEEQLIKKRETELKHVKDIRELYERKLERTNQLYLELCSYLQQIEQQQRQGGRKRTENMCNKRRIINPLVRRFERKRIITNNGQTPLDTLDVTQLSAEELPQMLSPNRTPDLCRVRRNRNSRASPRNSTCSRTSNCRSCCIHVDAGTQTDGMDFSETDLSPTASTSCAAMTQSFKMRQHSVSKENLLNNNCGDSASSHFLDALENGGLMSHSKHVILQEIQTMGDSVPDPLRTNNAGCVQLHYVDKVQGNNTEVFTIRPNLYNFNDRLNQSDKQSSDEDLDTINRKVNELKSGNMFSDMNITSETVNMALSDVIRQKSHACTQDIIRHDSTEDGCNDSFTDEENKEYGFSLRRKSLARRPIRRSARYKYLASMIYQHSANQGSDEGNTSEGSVDPSSKTSTLESKLDHCLRDGHPNHRCLSTGNSVESSDNETEHNPHGVIMYDNVEDDAVESSSKCNAHV